MLIKTNKSFMFVNNPKQFIRHGEMCSATALASSIRSFILGLRHRPKFSKATKELFKKGIEKHEEMQKGFDQMDSEEKYIEFRKKLITDRVPVAFKEWEIIGARMGVYGKADILKIHFDKNNDLNIYIDEGKSSWSINYLYQLFAYVLILTDFEARCVYGTPYKRRPIKPKKLNRKVGYLFPNPKDIRYINVWGRIFLFNKQEEQPYKQLVINNQVASEFESMLIATLKRLNIYQEIMRKGVVRLEDYEHDKWNRCCQNFPMCSKVDYKPKEKQFYLSKRLSAERPIIKSKPHFI